MMIKRFSATLASTATLLALLASCSSVDVKPGVSGVQTAPSDSGEQISADDPGALIKQGKLTEAAMLYLTIASRSSSPQRQDLQLKAIDLLTKDKNFETADNLLSELNPTELNSQQTTFYAYLNAKMAVNARNSKKSQEWLAFVKSEDYSSFASKEDILRLFIANYELASDLENAILNRISLEPFLSSEDDILLNQQAIIRGLLSLDSNTLQNIVQTGTNPVVRAWVDLSLLVKNSINPFRLGNQIKVWKEKNPQHPVRQSLIASIAPQLDEEPSKLENIALLLPLSGAFSAPATAIRDGFIASYYAQTSTGNAPTVRVYDTGKAGVNILAIYQQAIDNGANIIVGPLTKQAINEIALNANHNIPTLVLNQLDDPEFYSKNFYQFSLSPEDEAVQTAQRAWLDGHNRAAIIFPDDKWGMRVSNAFRDEWEKLGGDIVTETDYQSKKNDFSTPIKALLAIDKSTDRKNALSSLLKTRLKFEPRRRQDIDFIFMASFPKQARLIPPQLKFYHATDIPIYSTSHSYSGRVNRKKDRDLDSVIVGDMPWTLSQDKSDRYKAQIYNTWPNESQEFNRLYAFGTDSYNVLYYLNWLRANKQATLQGTTGELRMSENNQITRKLSWAKFDRGSPTLLPATAALTN